MQFGSKFNMPPTIGRIMEALSLCCSIDDLTLEDEALNWCAQQGLTPHAHHEGRLLASVQNSTLCPSL